MSTTKKVTGGKPSAPLDYSKWDDSNIWVSSDDDADCHPNIEKYAWRRLKARMRAEKGEVVKEVELKDKWSSTQVNKEETVNDPSEADPDQYLKDWKEKMIEYSELKSDMKADGYLMANPKIVSQLCEGFLITRAVDLAEANQHDKRIPTIARRCLQIHNINVSAASAKIPGYKSVPLFFKQLKNDDKRAEYYREFEKQLDEIKGRIETRRKERLAEAAEKAANPQQEEEVDPQDYEPAPLGPGGLDPTEVLQSLPEAIQQAFISQDRAQLVQALQAMPEEEAHKTIQRCIDSGLWNPGGADAQESQQPTASSTDQKEVKPEHDITQLD